MHYKKILRSGTANVRIQFILFTNGIEMKEFLKYSEMQETVLNELNCQRELLIDGSKL